MSSQVCPLGLCRFEEDCPNAPCLECMRRLGEHMIEEIGVLERQSKIAQARGETAATAALHALLNSLGIAIIHREQLA